MAKASAFARTAKMVVAEIADEQLGDATQLAMEAIAHTPELALELLSLIIKEGAKKRPDDAVLSAYAFLLGHALDQVRYAVDRESPSGKALADGLRRTVIAAVAKGRISPPILHLILHVFAGAKLEMGDELRELMQQMMEADIEAREQVEPGAWAEHLAAMVEQLEGDVFAIHTFLEETVTAMPEEMRVDFITATFNEADPALREATIGFLCSDWSALRYSVCELVEKAAPHGLISPTMLRRMITVRNWLPAEQRAALDRAVKACRQHGVECEPWPEAAPTRVLTTDIDGSGAQSFLVVLSERGHHTIAAVLGKIGQGVRDAWVRRKLPDDELMDVEQRFSVDGFMHPTPLGYCAAAARYLLAMNVAAGTMPPFGLLDVAESVGLDSLNPEAVSTNRLIDALIEDIPAEQLAPARVEAVLSMSGDLASRNPMLETWFEDNEDVRRVLSERTTKKKQRAALITGPLESRRDYWTQLAAWTAFAMKNQVRTTDWQDFAILARELASGRPLAEVPLMLVIADATIAAHAHVAARG